MTARAAARHPISEKLAKLSQFARDTNVQFWLPKLKTTRQRPLQTTYAVLVMLEFQTKDQTNLLDAIAAELQRRETEGARRRKYARRGDRTKGGPKR